MSFEIITYLFLSFSSCFLGALYFLYPKNAIKFFLVLSLILPTSNQFMNYTSFSGIYFYDFFFLLFSFYYLILLIKEKIIFKKNIINISIAVFLILFYSIYAFSNSVVFDKYLLRDIRPFLTLFYAFVIVSTFKQKIISINELVNVLILVFVFKIVFFLAIYFGFSFNDKYYEDNIFRYFDASTFIACLYLIFSIFKKNKILESVPKLSFNLLFFLSCIVILISNLRILLFALIVIYFIYSRINLFKKFFSILSFIFLFISSSYLLEANRILDANSSKGVAIQLATRFGPAIEKISKMNNLEYIYGLGLGTYFEITWFKYRGLDTKLNTIDSTYLSLFVKYGFLSLLIIFVFFRLLLFNINNTKMRASYIIFYLIIFFTLSSLYQSGTIFHFLFLNLLIFSVKDESPSHSISVST